MADPMTPQEAQDIINGKDPKKPDSKKGGGLADTVGNAVGGVVSGIGQMLDPGKGPDVQDFQDWLNGGGPGGGNGGSGGGSGGGFDPAQQAEIEYKMALSQVYMQLWGENIPASTLNMAVSQGMNIYEFEDWIRRQPAFKKTETYQDEYADRVMATARALGVLP